MAKIKIERLDYFGRGIGYLENKVTFVENTLPEEIVDISIIKEYKKYNLGKVNQYELISSKRKTPICPYYKKCGGCQLQHMDYKDTIFYKKEKLENILTKNYINFPEISIVENDKPFYYRNKLSLKIENSKIGFYEEKTHDLIEIDHCFLAKKSINKFLKQAKKLQIKNGFLTIRSNHNDELLIIIKTQDSIHFLINDYPENKIVGVVLNDKTIFGTPFYYERIYHCLFKISYDAFFQVNYEITKKMFELLEAEIKKKSKVLDLYAGVGTLGIIASKKAQKVYSVEIVKNAVLDNIENKKINQQSNISTFLGDAKEILKKIPLHFDTIIVDPPRKGLDKKELEILLKSHTSQIIYISCNPLTLVRDLKQLNSLYKIEKYYLLDMFSYTYHLESFVVLKKK